MKFNIIAIVLGSISFVSLAQASGLTQVGFNGPVESFSTVAQAKSLRDDASVKLQGTITRQVGDELYEFNDNSGSIYVEIDDEVWAGKSISPKDSVIITGEIDKGWNSVEVDVKSIRAVK